MNPVQFTRTLIERGDIVDAESTCELCGFTIQCRIIHGNDQLERKEAEHAKECKAPLSGRPLLAGLLSLLALGGQWISQLGTLDLY
jgi:hypothetical protein